MNELINKDNEWIIHFMGSLDRLLDNVEHLTASYRPTLNGERFFTDKEVSARLKVSRRTLQPVDFTVDKFPVRIYLYDIVPWNFHRKIRT